MMAAIIMPEAASIDRTQAIAEKVDAIFAQTPGVRHCAPMITGYSLLDSGFKTNAGDVLRHAQGFRGALQDRSTRPQTQNARAVLLRCFAQAQKIEEAIVHPDRAAGRSLASARPAASSSGSRTPGTGDPSQLDAGDCRSSCEGARSGRADAASSTTYSRQHAAAARQRRPRQGDSCSGIRSRTSTARSRRSSARSRSSQYNHVQSNVWWVIVQSDARYRQNPRT